MSALTQATIISGAIFAVVMATSYGRRELTRRKVLISLAAVALFGYAYLSDAPARSIGEIELYAAGIGLGLIFGAAATVTTKVGRSATGRLVTVTGMGFAAVWALAVIARLASIWSLENVSSVYQTVGQFMMEHRIEPTAIAPFFVLWALTMVVTRLAVIGIRGRQQQLATGARASVLTTA